MFWIKVPHCHCLNQGLMILNPVINASHVHVLLSRAWIRARERVLNFLIFTTINGHFIMHFRQLDGNLHQKALTTK